MGFVRKLTGSDAAKDANRAAQAQAQSGDRAIDEQRRQFDYIQELLAPFIQSGEQFLPQVQQGATVPGLSDRLGQVMSGDFFNELVDTRRDASQNQLSQVGLTRSGAALTEASRIPTELAFEIENLLFGRQQGLAASGQNAAVGQGGLAQQSANAISSLQTGIGDALAAGRMAGAQAQAQGTSNLVNTGVAIASMFFSDPRLKEDMTPIGQIGPLTLYSWKWKNGVPEMIGEMTTGFDADEVQVYFPEHVYEIAGFKAVDYPSLTDELRDMTCQ